MLVGAIYTSGLIIFFVGTSLAIFDLVAKSPSDAQRGTMTGLSIGFTTSIAMFGAIIAFSALLL